MNNEENQEKIKSPIKISNIINNENDMEFQNQQIEKLEIENIDERKDNQTEEILESHTSLITEKTNDKSTNNYNTNSNEIQEEIIEEKNNDESPINEIQNDIDENQINENEIINNMIDSNKSNSINKKITKEENIEKEEDDDTITITKTTKIVHEEKSTRNRKKKNKKNKKEEEDITKEEKEIEIEENNKEDENIEKQKELEKEREIKRQKELEKEREIERQKEIEKEREIERQKEIEKEREIEKEKIKTNSYIRKEKRNKINIKNNISDNNFIDDFLNELNNLRTSPNEYNDDFDEYEIYAKKTLSYKPQILNEITKLIKKIKNSKKGNKIQENEKLTELSNEYIKELKYTKGRIFYPKDQEVIEDDLNSIFDNVNFCKNYVCTNNNPKKALFDILFNEKDLIKGVIDRLINPEAKFIGISHEKIRNQPITVIIISDSINEKEDKNIEDGLLEEINRARNNPQSYLKYINSNHENYERILNSKKVSPLKINDILNKACEDRSLIFNKNPNEKFDRNQLIEFLENYGTNFFLVYEYINNEKDTAKDFIIEMLKNDYQTLLNRRLKEFGFSKTENGKIILIFVDTIDPKPNIKQISISKLTTTNLNRPEFTEDEEIQIRNDFQTFDSRNLGLIKPKVILTFADNDKDFANRNPFYYTALKDLNTEDNNKFGIDVETFINAVKRVIREYDAEDFENNWAEIFNLYFGEKRSNFIDKDILITVIKDMGFKLSDDEINDILSKIDYDLDLDKFTQIMKDIELNYRMK